MIVSRSPLRVSLFGGGSDFREYFNANGGAVLSIAINHFTYVIIKKCFEPLVYVNWSKYREVCNNSNEVKHDLIRESLLLAGIQTGVEVTCLSDVPGGGTGLGSSSSFMVASLNAAFNFVGIQKSNFELGELACKIEIDLLKKPIGVQDQYISALGGFQFLEFKNNNQIINNNLYNKSLDKVWENFYLIYTEQSRKSDSVLVEQKHNVSKNEGQLKQIVELAYKAKGYFINKEYDELGFLLDQAWNIKKQLSSNISNKIINEMYSFGLSSGATGGKLCGAGNGGFLLFYVPRSNHIGFEKAFSSKKIVKFSCSKLGAATLLNDEK